MVHIFGDSHAWRPYDQIVTQPQIHYFVGITMKRLGHLEEHSIHNWIPSINPPDTMIIVCGEIDIRVWAHVHETERKKNPAVFLVDWVNRYLDKIATAPTNGTAVYVQSITPSGRGDAIRNLGYNWPVAGSDTARASYTAIANTALAAGCQSRGLRYFDVYSRYVDSDGMLNLSRTVDNVHIDNPIALRNLLVEHGLV
jgi:hypothetical protein